LYKSKEDPSRSEKGKFEMVHHSALKPALNSFTGSAEDLNVRAWTPAGKETGIGRGGPDMTAMARWALHYLVCNPQKARGYECRFAISPLGCPPAPGDNQHDPVAVGDTESRMELEFIYMRDMTGMSAGERVEQAIRSRLLSYVRDDGLCWCAPTSGGEKDPTPAAMPWTTGHLLRSSAERYLRTGDEREHQLCRRLVEGLKRLATSDGNRMWYEGGLAAWRDGEWLSCCRDHYPSIINPLYRYWQICKEDDVLAFAEAMAEGIVAGVQKNLANSRVNPDGSHSSGNCHLVMRAALGVAQVGLATNNDRLIEWARRVYEFTRSRGTDWGWYPENIATPEKRYWSETCIAGDMVESAAAFAEAGYPEYWDHIERTVRNYLPEAQFFLTPEFEELYRKTHADKGAEVEKSLALLRKFEGGFLARQRPNDWVYRRYDTWQVNMMGCCPPEGMRSLYLAWANTVTETSGGVYVNMSLDRDAPAARVITHAPRKGVLEVHAKKPGTFFVRPPSWVAPDTVRLQLNGRPVPPRWREAYLEFPGVRSGDKLQIDYPLPRFVQKVSIGCEQAEEFYDVEWTGNDIEKVSPPGAFLPIFTGSRRPIPPLPDESVWEDSTPVDHEEKKILSDSDWNPNGE
jgi:hypothetical protein